MKLKLINVKDEIADAKTFVFRPEEDISWQPGQYMHYFLKHPDADDRGIERWFTISSAPFEKHITITTRLAAEKGSTFKRALNQLTEGDTIEAEGPGGKFILREGGHRHILIAGGIGITPYRSMLAQLDHDDQGINADLLYANRDDHLIFYDELSKYEHKQPNLHIKKFIGGKLIEQPDLEEYAKDSNNVFYLSGPYSMVESYKVLLPTMGVAEDNIMTDFFPGYDNA